MPGPFQHMSLCAVRISRLLPNGAPDSGNPVGAFALCSGLSSLEFDYEVDEGADIVERDACGNLCVTRKYPDRVKRVNFTLTLCTTDYRVDEILGIADAVVSGTDVVGKTVQAAAGCAPGAEGNGVALEFWSEQWDCAQPGDDPYVRSVFPRAYLTPRGFTREAGVAKPVYSGYAIPNPNFGDGPFNDLAVLAAQPTWVYAEVDAATLPTCPDPLDYIPLP